MEAAPALKPASVRPRRLSELGELVVARHALIKDRVAALMRGLWVEIQNLSVERAGEVERVDHRSLEAQREAALERGDSLAAEELNRAPELKLGPAANSMERREMAAAEREDRDYVPVTERGAVVHASREARVFFAEMRQRLELARETWGIEREAGQGRVSAGLAALRAAVARDRGEALREDVPTLEPGQGRERLRKVLGRELAGPERAEPAREERSIRERLDDVLNKPRKALEPEEGQKQEKEQSIEKSLKIDRRPTLELRGGESSRWLGTSEQVK